MICAGQPALISSRAPMRGCRAWLAGELRGQLRGQTERHVKDDRFERFITDFTQSWLNLREMDFTIPDRTLYPNMSLTCAFPCRAKRRHFCAS